MAGPEVVSRALSDGGLDAVRFGLCIQDYDIKQALKVASNDAVQSSAFGAVPLFVGDEMFFGQDRLYVVEKALAGSK